MISKSWIGVDLDSTWASTEEPASHIFPFPIGKEIKGIRNIIDDVLATGTLILGGRTLACDISSVKCFTARANDPDQLAMVRVWLIQVGLPMMTVTATKDFDMLWCLDDRAITVIPSTGKVLAVPHWIRETYKIE